MNKQISTKTGIAVIAIIALIFALGVWKASQRLSQLQSGQHTSSNTMPATDKKTKDQSCVNSGGIVASASCCGQTKDFPNNCAIGACGCAPANSHQVKTCNCGEGKCFDGNSCVGAKSPTTQAANTLSNTDNTTNWKNYTNAKYNFSLKYPTSLSYSENEIPASVQKTQILENGQGPNVFNLTIAKEAKATVVNSGIGVTVSKRGSEKDPLACDTQNLVSRQETTIDNQNANKCTFKGAAYTDDNKFIEGVTNVSYRVAKGNFVYEVASLGTHVENLSSLDQMIGTFKFIK